MMIGRATCLISLDLAGLVPLEDTSFAKWSSDGQLFLEPPPKSFSSPHSKVADPSRTSKSSHDWNVHEVLELLESQKRQRRLLSPISPRKFLFDAGLSPALSPTQDEHEVRVTRSASRKLAVDSALLK